MKSKVRFNILDAAIILLAAAMLVTVIFRQDIIAAFEKHETAQISYSFSSVPVKFTCAESLPDVTTFYLADELVELGTISEISKDSASPADPNYITISGSATVTAEVKDDGYYIDGVYLIAAGCSYTVRDGFSQYEICISGISVLE